MLMIVRLFPKTDISKVWHYVENEIKDEHSEAITPLYATQTEGMMNVGVIFDVKDADSISRFLTEEIIKCDEVHHTKTISLMNPVFFPIPKKKPENIQRYVIRVYAHPRHYKPVYEYLTNYNYPFNMFPIYISYSLGDEDIIMNIAADSRATIKRFLSEHVRTLDGVDQASFYPVHKSKRFTTLENLMKHEKRYMTERAKRMAENEVDAGYDWVENFEEYAKLTGAFPGDY